MTDLPDARTYQNFADLARAQVRGRDYEITVRRQSRSRVAVIAPHGGEIENGTSEVASAIADEDFNLYLFEGTRASRNYFALHLTSRLFDEPECLRLIADCAIVVAVHGCAGTQSEVLLGGRDTELRDRIADALAATNIAAAVYGHRFPATHASNVCNRGASGRGVQLELTDPLRSPGASAAVIQGTRLALLRTQLGAAPDHALDTPATRA